jgi:serine/threonine protein kinase
MYQPTIGDVVPGPGEGEELRLREFLGIGAFGIVFRAESSTSGENFAVKFLQGGLMESDAERLALANEIGTAGEVDHPNVVKLIRGVPSGHRFAPFLITEFANGGTLQTRIEQARSANQQLPLNLVRGWCLSVAHGMRAINTKFLHRDLKPDNILVHDEDLKIADFGLSKLRTAATRSKTFKGVQHLLFKAPEVWLGGPGRVQADMYSAGIVFFQVATLGMHLLTPATDPRSLRPDLPFRFSQAVLRMLEKRPEARYESWDNLIEALEASFDSADVQAVSSGLRKVLETASRRHQENQRIELEKEAAKLRREEELEVDRRQAMELMRRIEALVAAFNREIEAPKARFAPVEDRVFRLEIPYATPATAHYFWLKPEVNFPQGNVRLVAGIRDAENHGINFILVRQPGETYGRWIAVWVRVRVVAGEPDDGKPIMCTSASMYGDVAVSAKSEHIYDVEFLEDVDQAIEATIEMFQHP